MKPHEETWEVFSEGVLVAVRDVATKHLRANVNYKADRAALVAAAPEMARALLRLKARLEAQGIASPTYSSDYGMIIETLTKAGVLP